MNFWLSSFVQRWHTHPRLSKTGDSIAGHQQRVTMILLKLDPNISRQVLIRAITHDQGEAATGDLPYTFKRQSPAIREAVTVYEDAHTKDQGFNTPRLSEYEKSLVSLADWTDSYLWARHHEPEMVENSKSWQEQLLTMCKLATKWHVSSRLYKVLEESQHE